MVGLEEIIDLKKESSYKVLFDIFYRQLCTFAFHLLRDDRIAEEVVDDVFYNLWKNRNSLDIKSIRAYLFKSVRNRCLTMLKSSNKKREKYYSNVPDEEVALFLEQVFVDGNDPEEDMMDKELNLIVGNSISRLPEQCKAVFLMSRRDGMTYKEISSKMNISINTVKYHLKAALSKIHHDIDGYFSGDIE